MSHATTCCSKSRDQVESDWHNSCAMLCPCCGETYRHLFLRSLRISVLLQASVWAIHQRFWWIRAIHPAVFLVIGPFPCCLHAIRPFPCCWDAIRPFQCCWDAISSLSMLLGCYSSRPLLCTVVSFIGAWFRHNSGGMVGTWRVVSYVHWPFAVPLC